MSKKSFLISIVFFIIVSLSCTGCMQIRTFIDEMKTGVDIQNKDTQKAVVDKSVDYGEEQANQKNYTKDEDAAISLSELGDAPEAFEDNNKTLTFKSSTGVTTMTFGELGKMFDKRLDIKYNDYKITESLVYDYIKTTEKDITGIYLENIVDEVRQEEQYYRDEEISDGKDYTRNIVAVKYLDKENEEYAVGTFTSKEENKTVDINWKNVDSSNKYVDKLTEDKKYNFSGITNFYYFSSPTNFKVRCQAPLTRFKEWLSIENAGTKTLRNIEAKVTRDIIKDGETITEEVKVKPLDSKFYYDITVNEDTILLEISKEDLTEALKKYYALFDNYDIKSAEYSLEIKNASEDLDFLQVEDLIGSRNKASASDANEETEEETKPKKKSPFKAGVKTSNDSSSSSSGTATSKLPKVKKSTN